MRQGKCLAGFVTAGAVSLALNPTAALRASGLYVTAADYREARLTSAGDCKSDEHQLELHNLLNKPYIDGCDRVMSPPKGSTRRWIHSPRHRRRWTRESSANDITVRHRKSGASALVRIDPGVLAVSDPPVLHATK